MRRRILTVWLLVMAVGAIAGHAAYPTWLRAVAGSLVCVPNDNAADTALIDNVDANYLQFARASQLKAAGLAPSVVVPILRPASNDEPAEVALGIVGLMCRASGLQRCDTIEVPVVEPISLNLARHVAAEIEGRGARSVLLVTPGLRSQRSLEVYTAVLGLRGIAVHCQPVFGAQDTSNWFESAHGVQDVVLQFLKLWYYRILVLPLVTDDSAHA